MGQLKQTGFREAQAHWQAFSMPCPGARLAGSELSMQNKSQSVVEGLLCPPAF